MTKKQDDTIRGIGVKSLAAWEELYRSYYPALCSYAANVTGRSDVAEDIVQELLVDLWRSDRRFDTMQELAFFLYKAVYNNSLHYLRTCRIHSGILLSIGADADIDDAAFAETIREELLRKLWTHIERLPAERRRIMTLSLEGHRRDEIAAMLGISPNTVKAQKTNAVKTLRDALGDTPLVFFL